MNVTFGTGIAFVDFAPQSGSVTLPTGDRSPLIAAPRAGVTVWTGHYRIEIEGRTDEQIIADVDRIQAYHAAKSDRLNALAALTSVALAIGDVVYEWGASIVERGSSVELVICGVDSLTSESPKCLPLSRYYATIDDVATDAEIVAIVTAAIAAEQQIAADRASQIARLQAQLGVQP